MIGIKKINKFTALEYVYIVATLCQTVAQYTLKYAVSEDKSIKLMFLFPIASLVLSFIFKGKFNGGLEFNPVSTLGIYKLVCHGVPASYYFMFRRIYRPAIPYVLVVILLELIQMGAIVLDQKICKTRRIKGC